MGVQRNFVYNHLTNKHNYKSVKSLIHITNTYTDMFSYAQRHLAHLTSRNCYNNDLLIVMVFFSCRWQHRAQTKHSVSLCSHDLNDHSLYTAHEEDGHEYSHATLLLLLHAARVLIVGQRYITRQPHHPAVYNSAFERLHVVKYVIFPSQECTRHCFNSKSLIQTSVYCNSPPFIGQYLYYLALRPSET